MTQLLSGISSFLMKAINSIPDAVKSKREKENSGDYTDNRKVKAFHEGHHFLPGGAAEETEEQDAPEDTGKPCDTDEPEPPPPPQRIDPADIPKFVNQLVKLPAYMPLVKEVKVESDGKEYFEKRHVYYIDITECEEQILPEGFPKTKVWGYGGLIKDEKTGESRYHASSPGPTFEAVKEVPVMVSWRNLLYGKHPFAVDPTLHWANPNDMPMHQHKPWPKFPPGFPEAQFPIPTVTHLHGAEVTSDSDGHPEAWFTFSGKTGPAFTKGMYLYPNSQEPATLWYHDHALGMTRLNVYAGLAGFYLLREPERVRVVDSLSFHGDQVGEEDDYSDDRDEFIIEDDYSDDRDEFILKDSSCSCLPEKPELPTGKYEIPLVIQDRSFKPDGSLLFNEQGFDPEMHPYWVPGFIGDTIMVNGKVWPNLDVERRQYRFRLLNGSNARFYNLKLSNGIRFTQIGCDGGLLREAVALDEILIAPAERMDVLIDFSEMEPGNAAVLLNDAAVPYPNGFPVNEHSSQVMQFTVPETCAPPVKPPKLPKKLNDIVELIPDIPERVVVLNESVGPTGGPTAMYLDGLPWSEEITETCRLGATEDWVIVNAMGGSHPIHLHLIQFQIIDRQDFKAEEYLAKWEEVNGKPPLDHIPELIPVGPYLTGDPVSPGWEERGWKDTVKVYPDQVTRIRVRFAPQHLPVCAVKPGENHFPFDPEQGPGYVWHCHILDHEDNEMMRPMQVSLSGRLHDQDHKHE